MRTDRAIVTADAEARWMFGVGIEVTICSSKWTRTPKPVEVHFSITFALNVIQDLVNTTLSNVQGPPRLDISSHHQLL
jgi:hypothetical protein